MIQYMHPCLLGLGQRLPRCTHILEQYSVIVRPGCGDCSCDSGFPRSKRVPPRQALPLYSHAMLPLAQHHKFKTKSPTLRCWLLQRDANPVAKNIRTKLYTPSLISMVDSRHSDTRQGLLRLNVSINHCPQPSVVIHSLL